MIPRILPCALILVLASAPGFAQTSGKSAVQPGTTAVSAAAVVPAIPKDPNKLMLLAMQLNGLSSMGTHPWHVKAKFQTFDADGKPKDQGAYEEWWAGPEQYKVSYTSSGFNQVHYENGGKSLVTGDTGWAPLPQHMVEEYLVYPLPIGAQIARGIFAENDRKIGSFKLQCAQTKNLSPLPDGRLADYCFASGIPAIRIESFQGGMYVLFDQIVTAGGHYLAEQIVAQNSNLPIVKVNVDSLEFPSKIDDAVFAPIGKVSPAPVQRLQSLVLAGKRIGGEDPHYPPLAKAQRIQGMVMLDAKITKAGTIGDLSVVSGPKELQKSAFDAVKTWKYKPYLLNGQPVDVRTEINVIYTMGG